MYWEHGEGREKGVLNGMWQRTRTTNMEEEKLDLWDRHRHKLHTRTHRTGMLKWKHDLALARPFHNVVGNLGGPPNV